MDFAELSKISNEMKRFNYTKYSKELNEVTLFLPNNADKKERLFYVKNNLKEIQMCEVCKINRKKFNEKKSRLNNTCSKKCSNSDIGKRNKIERMKETNLAKYGKTSNINTSEFKRKSKETLMNKYGVDNPMKNKDIAKKVSNTLKNKKYYKKLHKSNLDNFGSISPMNNDSVINTVKLNNINKYGVDNPMKSPDIAKKLSNINLEKSYNHIINNDDFKKYAIPLFNLEEFKGTSNSSTDIEHDFKCKKCNKEFKFRLYSSTEYRKIPRCPKCYPKSTSSLEMTILELIKKHYDGIILQNSKIDGTEIDILLPDIRLGFECNGLYWHSEKNGKDSKYHLNKTNVCENLGIQLIHLYEDEIYNKLEIIESKIAYLVKSKSIKRIYARKCIIKEVGNKDKNDFLNKNHIQSKDISSIKLGLYYNSELVAIMTFSKPRKFMNTSDEFDFELVRFATLRMTNVIGGFSKLLKYFTKNYKFNKLITFADKRFSKGNLYITNNFEYLRISKPSYDYIDLKGTSRKGRYNRYTFRKNILSEKFPDIYSKDKSERQIMNEAGYSRIWNCGSIVFFLDNQNQK